MHNTIISAVWWSCDVRWFGGNNIMSFNCSSIFQLGLIDITILILIIIVLSKSGLHYKYEKQLYPPKKYLRSQQIPKWAIFWLHPFHMQWIYPVLTAVSLARAEPSQRGKTTCVHKLPSHASECASFYTTEAPQSHARVIDSEPESPRVQRSFLGDTVTLASSLWKTSLWLNGL